MKKMVIAAACAAALAFGGCVSGRGQREINAKPASIAPARTGASSFGDESYIWESWQYSSEEVDSAK